MAKKLRTSILAAIGLLVLILDTKTALSGASEGLTLCIQTVVPSLLPFFVLSVLLTSMLVGAKATFLRPLGRVFGLPQGAESLIMIGILGGYPSGAQTVAQAYRDGVLSRQDAQRMLPFCNLAGPAFLFGITGMHFSTAYAPWMLWGIHIISALFVAGVMSAKAESRKVIGKAKPLTLVEALQKSLRIMASVCGWIILFRIIIAFLERWFLWLLPPAAQVAITGLLELSNGCCTLSQIDSEGLRYVIASGLLAFGGLGVTMQTASVTQGLSLKPYIFGKLLQLVLSISLATLLQSLLLQKSEQVPTSFLFWVIAATIGVCIVKILHKMQKRYSISQPVGV